MKPVARAFRRLAVCAGALALSAGLARGAPPAGNKPVIIKPASMFEKCVTLAPPQKLEYHYDAERPVKFNVHYHKGDDIYYPVKDDKSKSGEGLFTPEVRQDYCLMWENKSYSSDVQLEYGYKIVK
jgi:hypothetical protein